MCKNDVTCAWNDVVLRRGRRGIESRCHERGLVLRLRTVAAAENEVLLTEHDVHGSFEVKRWGNDGAEGEELAEGLCLFVCDLDGKDWTRLVVELLRRGICLMKLTFRIEIGEAIVWKLN